jgi:hypothetical protein
MIHKGGKRLDSPFSDPLLAEGKRIIEDQFLERDGKVYLKTFNDTTKRKNFRVFVPAVAVVDTSEGTFEYRFSRSAQKGINDIINFQPRNIPINKQPKFDWEKNKELLVFLFACSSMCKNGLNTDKKKMAVVEFENRRADAKIAKSDKQKQFKVGMDVLNTVREGGVSLEFVIKFARAHKLNISEKAYDFERDEDVIRTTVMNFIEDQKLFDDWLNSDITADKYVVEEIITELMDLRLVKFWSLNNREKRWRFIRNDGTADNQYIGLKQKTSGNVDTTSLLRDELMRDTDLREQAKKRIASKRIFNEEASKAKEQRTAKKKGQVTLDQAKAILKEALESGTAERRGPWIFCGEEKIGNKYADIHDRIVSERELRERLDPRSKLNVSVDPNDVPSDIEEEDD